jgi:tRNA threonylcarbamoyl adenosine modification protein (Sua5/YciO/YrdC/YwlC family)
MPAIRPAIEALQRGALILMPTDTVYGLAADARLPRAQERLYEAKSRDRGKPIPLLAASAADAEAFGAVLNGVERRLAEKFWPGPLTLVLKVGDRKEGFRVPAHDVALALLRAGCGVLRVTSANISGEPPALTAEDAVRRVGGSVEVVLDAGPSPGGIPSTVAEVINGNIRILREGAIPSDRLERECRSVS